MPGKKYHIDPLPVHRFTTVLNTCDCFTCSFTEFLPFNAEMYYYSSFKAFRILARG